MGVDVRVGNRLFQGQGTIFPRRALGCEKNRMHLGPDIEELKPERELQASPMAWREREIASTVNPGCDLC